MVLARYHYVCTWSEICILHCTGVELSSKTKKLEWGTEDTDDDIDVEKTLELRQVRACHTLLVV